MRLIRFNSLIGFIFLTGGCATPHSGNWKGDVVSKDTESSQKLVISASEREELSSKHFGFINLTFENVSDEWVKVEDLHIRFENSELNEKGVIIVGDKISSWAEGIRNRQDLKRYNNSIIMGSLALVGTMAMAASSDSNVQMAGATSVLASAGGMAVQDFGRYRDSVFRANLVPRDHLLSGPLLLAPGLFVKRWFVVYTENPSELPNEDTVLISYRTNKEEKPTIVRLQFRYAFSREAGGIPNSPWLQRSRYTED